MNKIEINGGQPLSATISTEEVETTVADIPMETEPGAVEILDDITDLEDLYDSNTPDTEEIEDDEEYGTFFNDIIVPQGSIIDESELDEEEKELFFGKSIYINKEERDPENIFDALDDFRKMGEFIDVYLPMSNTAVRIYEFENDMFIPEIAPGLQSDNDFDYIWRDFAHNRVLMDKIFENMEIIAKDGKSKTSFDFERLSNLDTNILVLATAKLLLMTDPDTPHKDKVVLEGDCEKCGRLMELNIVIDDLLKAQYKKPHIKLERDIYDPYGTFEDNFNKSYHQKMRKKGVKYTKEGKNIEILITCKDPTYIEAVREDAITTNFLLQKYEKHQLCKDVVNTPGYKRLSDKDKLVELIRTIANSTSPQAPIYFMNLQADISNVMSLKYINRILLINKKEEKKNSIIKEYGFGVDTPVETLYEIFNKLPRETKQKIMTIVEEMHEKAMGNDIAFKYKCNNPKCDHEGEIPITARSLVFSVLRNRSRAQSDED